MFFARYMGPDKSGESFIEGKVYISSSAFSDGETVDLSVVRIKDEKGSLIKIDQEEDRFVYLEDNYAVVVNAFDEFEKGDVATVSGVSDDGGMFDVVGYGYRSMKDLVMLDRTNVYPGVVVMKNNGIWSRITGVNQSLSVTFEDNDTMMELSQVKFAVSDGDVMAIPVIMCVDAKGDKLLTQDKRYFLEWQTGDLYMVKDDNGVLREFFSTRFIFG